jgi:hypothetical protein
MPAQDADNSNQSGDKPSDNSSDKSSSGEAANTSGSNSDAKGGSSDAAGANSGSSDAAQPTTPAAEDQGHDSGYHPGEPNAPYGENRDGDSSKQEQPAADTVTPTQDKPGEGVQQSAPVSDMPAAEGGEAKTAGPEAAPASEASSSNPQSPTVSPSEPAPTSEASAPSEEPKMPAQDADKSNQSGDKPSDNSSDKPASGEAANTSDSTPDAKGGNSDAAGANSGSSDAVQPTTTPAVEDQGRDSGYQPGEPSGPYGENRDGDSSKQEQPEANAVTPTNDAASSASVEGGSTERPEGLKAESEPASGTTEDFDYDIDEDSVGAPAGAVNEPSATLRDSQDAASHTAILSVMGGWIGQATERVGQVLRLVSGELSSKG